ncbi:hypothetical protein TRFO_41699 [Tritrichomonas foetus]|uniref:MRH domain-containing protein n=1 Tax=Tritrichomonas foetus TaxID=1144522 RepID=A0A1J4L3Q4_9EUKA|nr:hypothetical protein TRFO_41699 [Tritrichomonas foetus]|eukprot:OHT16604.1 hypothetical protein TRFO_41699 [Tritrichomonas foetus]
MYSFLLFLVHLSVSREPLYNIEMVSHSKEISKILTKQIIKIPGYQGTTLICAIPDKTIAPTYDDDPSELLSGLTAKRFTILNEEDRLEICIDGESRLNGASLGFHSGFEYTNKSLFSYTEKGAKCNATHSWSLSIEYQCDNTVTKNNFYIPAFWQDDECTVKALIKTSRLCQHTKFSDEHVLNIKCISENDSKLLSIPDIY